MMRLVFAIYVFSILVAPKAFGDITDPFDPFDSSASEEEAPQDDDSKTPDELIGEGELLLDNERLLDARTKFLKALQKDPKAYKAHMLLAGYYIAHVGHFRLALKYIRQAQAIFESEKGKPPYKDFETQTIHAHLLYLLSQARLNLDNYKGALDVLDEFTSHGYFSAWYPGTRAWILMKLGQVDEAIRVSRLGVLAGAEPGRTLNMLGILLSMRGDREESLTVFRDAITYEMALGTKGQPATPLNNRGEVFEEIFEEEKAENSYLRATSLPDGCEHILPALNLALLYIDQLNLDGAKRSLDNFDRCVAQYPLRNGEEHRALEHLARGRIDLLAGRIGDALTHFEAALQKRQWFGKIGTNEDDLRAGAMISRAQALRAKNARLSFKPFKFDEFISSAPERIMNRINIWWDFRRALQILTDDLSDLEDIYIRNTDSMIEYPTFGDALSKLPRRLLAARIEKELATDTRDQAKLFYDSYIAQSLLESGYEKEATSMLNNIISKARSPFDNLLRAQASAALMKTLDPASEQYEKLAHEVFSLNRAFLLNHGLTLPVNVEDSSNRLMEALDGTGFLADNSIVRQFIVALESDSEGVTLWFSSRDPSIAGVKVKGSNLEDVISKFNDSVFTIETVHDRS